MHKISLRHIRNVKEIPIRERTRVMGRQGSHGIQHLPPTIFYVLNTLELNESEVAQSCLTLCDLIDCSLTGSSIHGIFQARVLEWVTISFSRRSSQPRDWTQGLPHCRQTLCHLSHQGSLQYKSIEYKQLIYWIDTMYWMHTMYILNTN